MTTQTHTLDARGLNCPLPILRTRKAITGLEGGEILEVTSSDPGSVKDIASFCDQTGHELVSSNEDSGDFIFIIRKKQ
jgi:tRNA 2-thiouridine synthesizing protein A